jgi:polyhydroxyalkanoate synthase
MPTHGTKGTAVLPIDDEGIQDSLGSFERLLDPVDPIALTRSFVRALARASLRPHALVPACARSFVRLATAWTDVAARTLAGDLDEPVAVGPKDIRFDDPAWSRNPLFRLLLETYLASAQLLRDVVDAAEMDDPAAPKARFAATLVADAIAPTNYLPTNPAALKECFDTAGGSVVQGLRNFASDLVENDGWPKQVDATPFVLGQNTAATPGRVVFLHRGPIPGEEPHRVGGAARSLDVRDQLPQPRCVDARRDVRRLRASRSPHRHRRRAVDRRN